MYLWRQKNHCQQHVSSIGTSPDSEERADLRLLQLLIVQRWCNTYL